MNFSHKAIKIKVNKGKRIEYVFFDPANYYEIKNIAVEEVDGQTVENSTLYSNFKTQDGIVMPFTMQQEGGPMGGATVSLTTITLNPKLDAKVFDTPAK